MIHLIKKNQLQSLLNIVQYSVSIYVLRMRRGNVFSCISSTTFKVCFPLIQLYDKTILYIQASFSTDSVSLVLKKGVHISSLMQKYGHQLHTLGFDSFTEVYQSDVFLIYDTCIQSTNKCPENQCFGYFPYILLSGYISK